MKTIALVSGGVDSVVMAHQYPKAIPVFIKYQNTYLEQEYKTCQELFGERLVVVELKASHLAIEDQVFVPNRNMTFASIACTLLNPDVIMMAGLRDDNAVDKNPQAFREMSRMLTKFSGKIVKVMSPYFKMTKGQMVEKFLKTYDTVTAKYILSKTYSCYTGNKEECGECEACFRKWTAFKSNGLTVSYYPRKTLIDKYLMKLHEYDPERQARIIIALKSEGFKVVAMDLDGTLCMEGKGSGANYSRKLPLDNNIEKSNAKAKWGIVIIFTARLESDREVTEKWLQNHGVKYSALIMNKLPYTYLFDDRTKEI